MIIFTSHKTNTLPSELRKLIINDLIISTTILRGQPGLEPGTFCTQSRNHTSRPLSLIASFNKNLKIFCLLYEANFKSFLFSNYINFAITIYVRSNSATPKLVLRIEPSSRNNDNLKINVYVRSNSATPKMVLGIEPSSRNNYNLK